MQPTTAKDLTKIALSVRGLVTIAASEIDPTPRKMIIQGATVDTANARDINGQPIMIYEYVPPQVGLTVRQASQRQLLQTAVNFYKGLSSDQKKAYKTKADIRQISIWNQVLSEYMLNNPVEPPSQWDGGLTIFDAGESPWDVLAGMQWDYGESQWDNDLSIWNR